MNKKNVARPAKEKAWPVFVWSGVACLAALLVLLCLASAVLCRVDVPHSIFGQLVTGLCAISCLVGGAVLAMMTGEKGILRGAIVGLVLFFLLWGIGMLRGEIGFSAFAAIRLLIFTLAGAAGGYLGIARHDKKRRRRPM